MYHFKKKLSLIIELPVYQDRLNKLVYGYINNQIIDTPQDISYYITKYLYNVNDDKLIFQKVCDGKIATDKEDNDYMKLEIEMEIFMDEFVSKVVNPSHIKYYQVDYKCIEHEQSTDILVTIEIEHRKSLITKIIYPQNGIAFINIPSSIIKSLFFSLQVLAMGDNDNILIKSDWINFEQYPHRIPLILTSNPVSANKYFDTCIDTENNGFLELDDWVCALTKINELNVFEMNEMKRIFYYMIHIGGNDANNGIFEIDRTDFYEFIVCRDCDISDKYYGVYNRFINIVRSKIPNLFPSTPFF